MPRYQVTGPDGGTYEITAPEGASEQEVMGYAQRQFADTQRQSVDEAITRAKSGEDQAARAATEAEMRRLANPVAGQSFMENAVQGAGRTLASTARGVKQLAAEGANLVSPNIVSDETVSQLRREADEAAARDQPLASTGGGLVGGIAGHLAAAAAPGTALRAVGGGARLAGATAAADRLSAAGKSATLPTSYRGTAAAGAAQGAVQEVGEEDSRAANAGIGAGASVAGMGATRGLSRVIQPEVRPQVKALMDEGITPTPGQIIGGAAQRAEDAATSIPVLGDMIRSAQRRGVEDLNRAALSRPLKEAGIPVPKDLPIGNEGIELVGRKLGEAYDTVLARTNNIARDQAFGQEAATLATMVKDGGIAEKQVVQFNNILKNRVLDRFTDAGKMSGPTMKEVESELGGFIRRFGRSEDPNDQMLADALRETQAALRRLVMRTNPDEAEQLKAINTGWANFVRVETAAARQGSKEGVFSPAALRSAVRQTDSSVRKGQFARGDALMQDLADAGENVLGPKVPDSGTPFRLANMAAGGAGYWLSPELATTIGGASLAYTNPISKAVAKALTQRPDAAVPIARSVRASAPAIALAVREALYAGE